MLGVVATLNVHEDKVEEFQAIFRELAQNVHANEPGSQVYQLCRSRTDSNIFRILEIWESDAAIEAHVKSAHFKAAFPAMATCLTARMDVEYLDAIV